MKKKLFIIIPACVIGYYLNGFPLTISCVVESWPLFPGGITLKYEGNNNSKYDDEIIIGDCKWSNGLFVPLSFFKRKRY